LDLLHRHEISSFSTEKFKGSGKFSGLKNGFSVTTFHHAFDHKLTTKNHRFSPIFPKNPLKKRHQANHNIFCFRAAN